MSDPRSELAEARASFVALRPIGKAALAAACAAVLVLLLFVWDLVGALLGPYPTIPPVAEAERQSGERSTAFGGYVAQVTGRSLFHNPRAVVAEAPPPEPVDEGPRETPRPSSYGGPALAAMVFDEVWFADGQRLKVGDEAKNDLRVVSISPPWNARIEWKGVEFTVDLFRRDSLVFRDAGAPAEEPSSAAGDETSPEPAPGETPPAEPAPGETPPAEPAPGETPPAEPAPPAPETPPADAPRETPGAPADTTPPAAPNARPGGDPAPTGNREPSGDAAPSSNPEPSAGDQT
ncbi:MAG: hypothetical protein SFY69_05225 [Planctomycetota bacterium]|nr:hypothetical protein [Planctomycetota bacterium]